jgi:Protein of unknown function (DUF3175)
VAAKRKSSPRKRPAVAKRSGVAAKKRNWSKTVMQDSDAMDLKSGVFKLKSARSIALSLQKSAQASHRRKASPFQSAMSMLNFEINRAGSNLSQERLKVLNRAKDELRKAFGRAPRMTAK